MAEGFQHRIRQIGGDENCWLVACDAPGKLPGSDWPPEMQKPWVERSIGMAMWRCGIAFVTIQASC